MSSEQPHVEVSIRYETVVDDITDAWAFIMAHIEKVGPDPSVNIRPASDTPPPILQALLGQEPSIGTRRFHVAVEGSMQKSWDRNPEVVLRRPRF